jgi:hypothetical protein
MCLLGQNDTNSEIFGHVREVCVYIHHGARVNLSFAGLIFLCKMFKTNIRSLEL